MIARPALPAVLASLIDVSEGTARILAGPGALRIDEAGTCPADHWLTAKVRYPWITTDPAEAWEILDARGLLPPEGTRGFRVERSVGMMDLSVAGGGAQSGKAVLVSTTTHPATIPDLVAWASLGADAIVTAEALAVESCAALQRMGAPWAAAPCERVVWRVAHKIGGNMAFESLRAGRAMASDGRVFLIDDEVVMPTQEFVTAPKALSDMGIMLERVGAECVVCVPPIGGAT